MIWVRAVDRRASSNPQGADHADPVLVGLGDRGRFSRENGPSGRLGVDGIGLAPSMAGLAIGAIDLDHGAASPPQVPGQASAIGAGPLDAEPRRAIAEGLGPAEQPPVAGGRGGDLEVAQRPPEVAGEGCRHVDLAVGVDANGDAGGGSCAMLGEAILMSSTPPLCGA